MAERIFKGKADTITYEEADKMTEMAMVDLLYYVHELAKEASDDEEALANANVFMARKVGALRNACLLRGLLMDPDRYLEELELPEGTVATIEEVG